MKKLSVFSVILVSMLTFGLAFVSCNNDPTSGDDGEERRLATYSGTKSDVTFTLTISPPKNRAAHIEGDDYELVVKKSGSEKTSTGKFIGLLNTAFVLKPSGDGTPTFTVTVSGTSITNITGTITYSDGTSEAAPGAFSSGSSGTGNQPGASTTYTVTFNINGGVGIAPTAKTVNAGASITIPSDFGIAKSGHRFINWNTSNAGTGTRYSTGSSLTPTSNTTLYAAWEVYVSDLTVIYSITFDANGGSGTPPPKVGGGPGDAVIIPGAGGLSRSGFTFGGWNTNNAGTGTNYPPGSAVLLTDVRFISTLYAKWNGVGGGGGGTTYPINITVNPLGSGTVIARVGGVQVTSAAAGATVTVTATPASGYTFSGWSIGFAGFGTPAVIITANPYSFTMPEGAANVIAYFEASTPGTHTHQWGSWTVTTTATCTEAAVETRTCSASPPHSETRTGAAALGHDWGPWVYQTYPAGPGEVAPAVMVWARICKRDSSHIETSNSNPGGGGTM